MKYNTPEVEVIKLNLDEDVLTDGDDIGTKDSTPTAVEDD